jgi:hypothetical protein
VRRSLAGRIVIAMSEPWSTRRALVRACARAIAFAAFGTSVFSACSAVESFTGLAGTPTEAGAPRDGAALLDGMANGDDSGSTDGSTPAVDAGTADASSQPDDAGDVDGGDAANGTVVYQEDFEATGCDDTYGNFLASDSTSTEAHSGTKSCMICCTTAGSGFYTVDHNLPGSPPAVGVHARADAWVKAVMGAALTQDVQIYLRTHQDTPFSTVDQNQSAIITIPSDWTHISIDLAMTKGAPSWDVFVGARDHATMTPKVGDCFLVDDISITEHP